VSSSPNHVFSSRLTPCEPTLAGKEMSVVEEAQALGLSRASRGPWRVGTHTNLEAGFVLARLQQSRLESPIVRLSRILLACGFLSVLFAMPLVSPVSFWSGLVAFGLGCGCLFFLSEDTLVTLEEGGVQVRNGARLLLIPRGAGPHLVAKTNRYGEGEWDLAWTSETGAESRLHLGALSGLAQRAFRLWRGQLHSARTDTQQAESSLTCVVEVASPQRTCPLCRDLVQESGADLMASCSKCEVLYHEDCWRELGGCALPSCRGLVAGARSDLDLRFLSSGDARSA
jgi:hypothetical protein